MTRDDLGKVCRSFYGFIFDFYFSYNRFNVHVKPHKPEWKLELETGILL